MLAHLKFASVQEELIAASSMGNRLVLEVARHSFWYINPPLKEFSMGANSGSPIATESFCLKNMEPIKVMSYFVVWMR